MNKKQFRIEVDNLSMGNVVKTNMPYDKIKELATREHLVVVIVGGYDALSWDDVPEFPTTGEFREFVERYGR